MPRHRFTLAALATSATPGLDVAETQEFTGGGDGDFDSALLTAGSGEHLVVRTPNSPDAAGRLGAEARGLGALTAGVRSRLPFGVAEVRSSSGGDSPAVLVTTYVPGQRLRPEQVRGGSPLAASIGAAIAAVHDLPTAVVVDQGLPVASAVDCQRTAQTLLARAQATGRVPRQLAERWQSAVDDGSLWRFQPAVVHGSLRTDAVLTGREAPAEQVSGLLGWGDLAIGDPAGDLAWVLALPAEGAASDVFAAYQGARRGPADVQLRKRAMLAAELDLARWLMWGVETGDEDVVEDAAVMLRGLLRSVQDESAASLMHETLPVLSIAEVERMLADHQVVGTGGRSAYPEVATRRQSSRSSVAE